MFVGAVAGGGLLCAAAGLRLKQLEYSGENPYCGAPVMMIYMCGAWLGVVLGAGVGIFSVVFEKGKDTQPIAAPLPSAPQAGPSEGAH